MPLILAATAEGLRTFDETGESRPVEHAGRAVTALAPIGGGALAVLDGSELIRREPDGAWERLAGLDGLAATCLVAVRGEVLAGSAGARLFRLLGDRFEPVTSFDEVGGRSGWHTPRGGPPAVRSIANWDETIYVNVHVGGIPRSDDAGATWAPTIDIEADVHHVTTAEGLVLAACAGGLAVSSDAGATWTVRADGLDSPYARAVAVYGDRVLLSASRGPRGGRAAVYRGDLASGRLERCRTGLPDWFEDNIDTYCLDALPDGAFAAFGTADGRLFGSADAGASWAEIASGLPRVTRVLVLPAWVPPALS